MTSKVTTVLVALAMVAGLTGDARGQSQNELIEQRVLPHLEPGKVALGLSLLLVNTPPSDPRFASYLQGCIYRIVESDQGKVRKGCASGSSSRFGGSQTGSRIFRRGKVSAGSQFLPAPIRARVLGLSHRHALGE